LRGLRAVMSRETPWIWVAFPRSSVMSVFTTIGCYRQAILADLVDFVRLMRFDSSPAASAATRNGRSEVIIRTDSGGKSVAHRRWQDFRNREARESFDGWADVAEPMAAKSKHARSRRYRARTRGRYAPRWPAALARCTWTR
jgi:hypothetical protein